MNCGHLSAKRRISSGSGWLSMPKHGSLSVALSARATVAVQKVSGNRFLLSIANVPSATPIFGLPMLLFSRPNGIELLAKTVAKRTTSSASTIPFASAAADSSVIRSRFQRSLPITSVRFGISFTTTTRSTFVTSSLLLVDYPTMIRFCSSSLVSCSGCGCGFT